MGRPQAFDTATAVRAARDLFWDRGYDATSLTDLEQATGLSRSSLYNAFGSKRGLFDHAVRDYLDTVVAPRLAPLRAPDAGPHAAVTYLRELADVLADEASRSARLGCLLVNTSTSIAARDETLALTVSAHRDDLVAAFTDALTPCPDLDAPRVARTTAALTIAALTVARTAPQAAAELLRDAATDLAARTGPTHQAHP